MAGERGGSWVNPIDNIIYYSGRAKGVPDSAFNDGEGNSQPQQSQSASSGGTYWLGADGNVWVAGSQGVNSAGRFDSNTDQYWQSRGYAPDWEQWYTGSSNTGGSNTGGSNTGGSTNGGYDSYAAQQAAEEAKKEQQRQQLRGDIRPGIEQVINIYRSLFGEDSPLAKAVASQGEKLSQRNASELEGLTAEYKTEMPALARSFAGRGLYDSSYRRGAVADATSAFERATSDVNAQYADDAAKLGQYKAEQEAEFQAGIDKANKGLQRLDSVTSIDELTSLRAQIDAQIADLNAKKNSTLTQESYMDKFNQMVPATDRTAQLRNTLGTLIRGSAPGQLKQSVAAEMIGSSGLPLKEQEELMAEVTAQIGQ